MLLVYKVGTVVVNRDHALEPFTMHSHDAFETKASLKIHVLIMCIIPHYYSRSLSLPAHFHKKQIYNNYG